MSGNSEQLRGELTRNALNVTNRARSVSKWNVMRPDKGYSTSWYDLVPLFDDKHLAIRGIEKDDLNARFQLRSSAPLARTIFELFTWNVSIDKPAEDAIGNNLGWLIFSSRAKGAVETVPHLNAEFLEVPDTVLRNAKHGCPAWVFHPLTTVRAINLERSKVVWENYGKEDFISVVHELWLDEQTVGKCPAVFRLAEYPPIVLANADFVTAWLDAKCTGLRFVPVHTA